jgi:hypothetical protein
MRPKEGVENSYAFIPQGKAPAIAKIRRKELL